MTWLRPVLAALAGWLAVMYGIQHSLISVAWHSCTGIAWKNKLGLAYKSCHWKVPFLTGNQYEYFPIIATFIATWL